MSQYHSSYVALIATVCSLCCSMSSSYALWNRHWRWWLCWIVHITIIFPNPRRRSRYRTIFMAKQLWYQDVADQLRSETKVMWLYEEWWVSRHSISDLFWAKEEYFVSESLAEKWIKIDCIRQTQRHNRQLSIIIRDLKINANISELISTLSACGTSFTPPLRCGFYAKVNTMYTYCDELV